jgi:His/Glu/Gln/Arg/opine family amino acid ABC transporter permease subunit
MRSEGGSPMPDVIVKNLPFLLQGLWVTVQLSFWTIIGGTAIGLVVGTIRHLRIPVLSTVAAIYVEFIRGTPLLVVLLLAYFGVPALLGYKTDAYHAALYGFIAFIGAYLAEDFRSGLRSVGDGVIQAGLATGLTQWQTLRLIVLPQAIRRVIPPVFNQYVRLFKFTSVASVIGTTELTGAALLVNAREFQPITIISMLALTYLVLCYGLSSIGRMLYSRFAIKA